MAGIYIHIPFCRKACHYCNFHFSTSTKQIDEIVQAICKETILRSNYITENITTIYFGGGTPSLLSVDGLLVIINKLYELFTIDKDTEITLEANPDDINTAKLTAWKAAGINRLSIGVQSFFEEDLQWMNRAHNAAQALQSILLSQTAGFSNITIDLIYGTPTLSDKQWQQNFETAASLNIPHLSCYALTVEPKTALEKMIAQHTIENVDADKQSRHFELLMQWAAKAGYEHYEISNFAKPGFRSKHNSSYWQGKEYLGLGPSAHSFNGSSRQWNVANNTLYLKSIEQNTVPFEIEHLTEVQQLNEYIMTSLRTMEGLSILNVTDKWGAAAANKIIKSAKKYLQEEMMFENTKHLMLTQKGKLFADGIAAELFY
ncbi:MAG TPA: radical SAM family heme chaperone HemW [Panacibacter sp.]|nr:radical SAM family heme chaperone HemW [Panacibacter sp.]